MGGEVGGEEESRLGRKHRGGGVFATSHLCEFLGLKGLTNHRPLGAFSGRTFALPVYLTAKPWPPGYSLACPTQVDQSFSS